MKPSAEIMGTKTLALVEHGAGHEHGTSGDHCTHAHSMGVPVACRFAFFGGVELSEVVKPPLPAGHTEGFHFRPPKA